MAGYIGSKAVLLSTTAAEVSGDADIGGSVLVDTIKADNGTTGISIDSSGHVTMPNQPAFLVRPSGTQSNVSINASTTIIFGTDVYDQNSDFSSNTFTAPVTGKYLLSAVIRVDSMDLDTTYYSLKIATSNATFHHLKSTNHWDADPSYYQMVVTIVADMDASDTAIVMIEIPNNGAAQADISEFSYFSGALLC